MQDHILLTVVKPCIETVESTVGLETFHFLFEPDGLNLRVRAKKVEELEKLRNKLNNCLEGSSGISFFESKYTGEEEAFGVEGWKYVQKLFEYGSRISLLNRETRKELETHPEKADDILKNCKIPTKNSPKGQFFDSKLIHCFLNQMGYDIIREAEYCIRRFQGRIEVLRRVRPKIFSKTKQGWVELLIKVRKWLEQLKTTS